MENLQVWNIEDHRKTHDFIKLYLSENDYVFVFIDRYDTLHIVSSTFEDLLDTDYFESIVNWLALHNYIYFGEDGDCYWIH